MEPIAHPSESEPHEDNGQYGLIHEVPEIPKFVSLVARLQEVFRDVALYKRLLGCRGSHAQKLLNSFQWLLDIPELDSSFRRSLIVATQRISKQSGLYPVCYELRNIVQDGQHPLAAGGFADIYKADFEGLKVCLKAIRIYQNTEIEHFLKQFSKEAILWGQLSHPNLLPMYGLFRFENRVCLVSPWMEEGDINKYLKRRPEAPRLQLAVDVAQGLLYLHKNGIIHGDLKGPNILINEAKRATLADFGISSVSDSEILAWTSHSSAASKGGSVRWQAPELFDTEDDAEVSNSVASDVYAWACVGYEIFAGDVPFAKVLRDSAVMLKVKSGARPTRPPDSGPSWRDWGLTENIWAVMCDCWRENPAERPKIEQVIERLVPELIKDERSSANGGVLSPAGFRKRMSEPLDMMTLAVLDSLVGYEVGKRSHETASHHIENVQPLHPGQAVRAALRPLPPLPFSRPLAPPEPQIYTPVTDEKHSSDSTFPSEQDSTWIPRRSPEQVYEGLEEFFPQYDRDRPVIENSSYGLRKRSSLPKLGGLEMELWGSDSTSEGATFVQSAIRSPGQAMPESLPGATFKWVRGELIGQGTHGRVYLALNAITGDMIVVKQVEKPQTVSDRINFREFELMQALRMESDILKDLDHPNIVQYLGFEETSYLNLFLEYVPGGDLGRCLAKHGKFREEVTKSFTMQILMGLEYIHSKGILHRDVQAANILVDMSGFCKLADFGHGSGVAYTAMQGTIFWMPPEMINTPDKGYNSKIDIWSLGCVVIEMWTGERPWKGNGMTDVTYKLYKWRLPPPVPDLSQLADDFQRKCFAINPEERLAAEELKKHPYLVLPPDWVFTGFK